MADNLISPDSSDRDPGQEPVDLIRLRIAEHDKRTALLVETIRETKTYVDARAAHVDSQAEDVENTARTLGKWGPFGFVLGGLVLFIVVQQSVQPLVERTVEHEIGRELERVDLPAKIGEVAESKLEALVTSEVLADAVKEDDIQQAADAVIRSEAFQLALSEKLQHATAQAVSSEVDRMVAEYQGFEQIVAKQLEAERNRITEMASSATQVPAGTREELVSGLIKAFRPLSELGSDRTHVRVYPFADALHIEASIYWNTSVSEERRLQIVDFSINGVTASADEYKSSLENYFNVQAPRKLNFKPSGDDSGPKFILGAYRADGRGQFRTYDELATELASTAVNLVEDCFDIQYPVTWRVKVEP